MRTKRMNMRCRHVRRTRLCSAIGFCCAKNAADVRNEWAYAAKKNARRHSESGCVRMRRMGKKTRFFPMRAKKYVSGTGCGFFCLKTGSFFAGGIFGGMSESSADADKKRGETVMQKTRRMRRVMYDMSICACKGGFAPHAFFIYPS